MSLANHTIDSIRSGLIEKSPTLHADPIRGAVARQRFLTNEELVPLLAIAEKEAAGSLVHARVLLGAGGLSTRRDDLDERILDVARSSEVLQDRIDLRLQLFLDDVDVAQAARAIFYVWLEMENCVGKFVVTGAGEVAEVLD